MRIYGYASLGCANLRHTDLSGADLRYANLGYADLRHTDLRDVDLRDTNLRNANLHGANLRYIIGNGREIKSLFIDTLSVSYTTTQLIIGCQQHPITDWWGSLIAL